MINNEIAWLKDISHRPLMATKGSVSFWLSIGQHGRISPTPTGHEWQRGDCPEDTWQDKGHLLPPKGPRVARGGGHDPKIIHKHPLKSHEWQGGGVCHEQEWSTGRMAGYLGSNTPQWHTVLMDWPSFPMEPRYPDAWLAGYYGHNLLRGYIGLISWWRCLMAKL